MRRGVTPLLRLELRRTAALGALGAGALPDFAAGVAGGSGANGEKWSLAPA